MRKHPLETLDHSQLVAVNGGDRLLMRQTRDGVDIHRLTSEAEATYNQCSDAADKSWFPRVNQFFCNRDLAKSIEDNKVRSLKFR